MMFDCRNDYCFVTYLGHINPVRQDINNIPIKPPSVNKHHSSKTSITSPNITSSKSTYKYRNTRGIQIGTYALFQQEASARLLCIHKVSTHEVPDRVECSRIVPIWNIEFRFETDTILKWTT